MGGPRRNDFFGGVLHLVYVIDHLVELEELHFQLTIFLFNFLIFVEQRLDFFYRFFTLFPLSVLGVFQLILQILDLS